MRFDEDIGCKGKCGRCGTVIGIIIGLLRHGDYADVVHKHIR